ncbi:MAG: DNA polymerase III subunit beta [Clostridia bacterium]|nr:DNA polymerase III subunit beta [Clostridia bacterium]
MRFYVDCNEINAAVISVTKALPTRSTMPILDGIYFEATKEGLRLLCTDLLMQKECFVPATVEMDGKCVVPGKLFSEVLRKMPESILEIFMSGSTLIMQGGKTKNQIQCIDFDEFPTMSFTGDVQNIKVEPVAFKELINKTVFATAQDDSKPILNGINTEIEDNKITMVATDSYQFAMNTLEIKEGLPQKNIIIHGRAATEIARMMEEAKDEATLSLTNTHVKVDLGHTALVARLIDGRYIDYKRILPKESKTRVMINRNELYSSIERAQLVAKEGNNNIVMKFEGDMLTISADSYIGKVNDEIEVNVMGEDITISFNPKFCLNILRCISDETVYFEFTNNISPCVIRPLQGESYYYLIVPMRIY